MTGIKTAIENKRLMNPFIFTRATSTIRNIDTPKNQLSPPEERSPQISMISSKSEGSPSVAVSKRKLKNKLLST